MGLNALKIALGIAGIYTDNLEGEGKTRATMYALEHFCNAARDDEELAELRKRVAQKLGCTEARAAEVFSLIGDAAGELKGVG